MNGRRFRRRPDGRLAVELHRAEAELLAHLAEELTELLETPDPADPAIDRLFPRAYLDPTEEEAEQSFSSLVAPDLLRGRLDALRALAATVRPPSGEVDADDDTVRVLELDADQEAQWLSILNDARLALGIRLGVSDDREEVALEPDDPLLHAHQVYDWLTYLQGELVEVLLDELPDTDD